MTARAIFPPGEAREDWTIVRALSGVLAKPLPFDSLQALRAEMYASHPHLALLDQIDPAASEAIERLAAHPTKASRERFGQAIEDFYLSNPISRASPLMARLSAMQAGANPKATGTDG
jgi:NADH-quinone oxidoreductase subunit G